MLFYNGRLSDRLGSGQFGVVYKGVLETVEGEEGGRVEVAVKTLKEGSGEEDRVKFLQEAAIMGQFKHPNVVTVYGVVTAGEPVSFFFFKGNCIPSRKKTMCARKSAVR